MIVCSCHVISDHDIRSAIETAASPPRHLREVYSHAGVTPQCGRCAPTVRDVASAAGLGRNR